MPTLRKKLRSETNLSLYLKEQEKEEQAKPKVSKRSKIKLFYFFKDKFDKFLSRLTKKKRWKTQMKS